MVFDEEDTTFDSGAASRSLWLSAADLLLDQRRRAQQRARLHQLIAIRYGSWLPPTPPEEDEQMPPNVWRVQGAARRVTEHDDPAVPPGKVAFTRGRGTWNARVRLRALGGRWDPNTLGGVWLVPEEVADRAEANVRLAERSGQELPEEDTPEEQQAEKITCYVCGAKHATWEFARLKGAVLADWYCGCETRKLGATPRTATTRGSR